AHMPEAHELTRSFLIDGMSPQVADQVRDPNLLIEHLSNRAKELSDLGVDGVEKLYPKAAPAARMVVDQAGELSATLTRGGRHSANAMLAARGSRMLLATMPVLGRAAGAAIGAMALGNPMGGLEHTVHGWLTSPPLTPAQKRANA